MFDYLRVEMELPASQVPCPTRLFQTKDTPGVLFMNEWVLHEDGTLLERGYEFEDRSDPTAVGIDRVIGMLTRVDRPDLDVVHSDFHGDIIFYHWTSEDHWEYRARFTEGVCTSIVLLEEDH